MKKLLLASMLALAPFAVFAEQPKAFVAAGDINSAATQAGSSVDVGSTQDTNAQTGRGFAGAAGAVSGNYTTIQTGAAAKAGPAGSQVRTTGTQLNVGGTSIGKLGAASASGGQNSTDSGFADASAKNTNIGGFVAVQMPRQHGGRPTVR